ncbi:zeta toxin family protein [Salimicrobium salexigens]|uniref:UDP-N-acetylglucosamine kinase n=1 Tax=Salimicrobium salexigens TaxID=908941 RepID=A0ABY1KQV9_9BACI|nr:zeta toxin family protein [Salimicrobium salexigens]SIS66370.1 Predicted ABC-type ATPase [Salimicrobium salexigens]
MSSSDKPIMYIFAGNNGSGKSTIRNLIIDKIGIETNIDPDGIARHLDSFNPESKRAEAGRSAIKLARDCIKNQRSFSVETTLAGKTFLKRIKKARENGFEITMFYLGLEDVQQNIERVALRVRNGGHHIPKEDILKRHVKSKENLLQNLSLIDNLIVMDNSHYNGEVVLEAYNNSISYESNELPKWVVPIKEHLK